MKYTYLLFILIILLIGTSCQVTQEESKTDLSKHSQLSEDDVERHATKKAFFGDLHVHTSWSFDAFIYNVRTSPDDAYEFGKGKPIDHFVLDKIKINRPLDFMAVTDHSEYMGVLKHMNDVEHPLYKTPLAEQVRSQERATSMRAFGVIGFSLARNEPIDILSEEGMRKTTWQHIIEAADRHYEPGKFTTFAGYEFTSSPGDSLGDIGYARNLHRNVIYRNTDKISTVPFSSLDSQNPEDLWDWMDKERQSGIDLLAIPHNGNMSDGIMYATKTFDGDPIDEAYSTQRMRNEPINEVVQIKGQSMSHPILSPNDEFANFELFEYTFATVIPPPSKPQGSYVREAYQEGLQFQEQLGANPFKFGVIGSSDGHNSAAGFDENNYFGKFGVLDGSPEKRIVTDDETFLKAKYMSSGGLAGVWAESNTRDAIYDALERKETFATSGSRMQLRLYGGFGLGEDVFEHEDWLAHLPAGVAAMGGDLTSSAQDQKPSFAVWAVKDPEGANLDRIQLIKAWVDDTGVAQEEVINVVWAGDRELGADGSLPKLSSTVDVKSASYTNAVGAVALKAVWTDEDYSAERSCMYYMRVLEIATPRWSTYDARELGIGVPGDLEEELVERGWSSPIWVE